MRFALRKAGPLRVCVFLQVHLGGCVCVRLIVCTLASPCFSLRNEGDPEHVPRYFDVQLTYFAGKETEAPGIRDQGAGSGNAVLRRGDAGPRHDLFLCCSLVVRESTATSRPAVVLVGGLFSSPGQLPSPPALGYHPPSFSKRTQVSLPEAGPVRQEHPPGGATCFPLLS